MRGKKGLTKGNWKRTNVNKAVVCIVGLGYVGLPLAVEFSQTFKKSLIKKQKEEKNAAQVLEVIGFDIDDEKIENLKKCINREFKAEDRGKITFTSDHSEIRRADFVIIAVPTPVTKSKEPDLSYVKSAAEIVGGNLKRGAIVVLESTVYPSVTEEIVKTILERDSGMKCGMDFKIGYSPERINPGDEEHSIDKITKIVAGMDEETTEVLSKLYGLITNVYKAKDIKTAEAAKVIENIQRDLNIALMNELTIIFHKMGLDKTFLQAKTFTKNNNSFGKAFLLKKRFVIKGSKVLIMGLTYKENVPDTRESPVKEMVKELEEFGIDVYGYDLLLRKEGIKAFGIKALDNLDVLDVKVDCVIVTVDHDEFRNKPFLRKKAFTERNILSFSQGFLFREKVVNDKPVLVDVRGVFDEEEAKRKEFYYKRL